ncbi:hypothetical protein R6Q59_027244 [Mikania micrantha]
MASEPVSKHESTFNFSSQKEESEDYHSARSTFGIRDAGANSLGDFGWEDKGKSHRDDQKDQWSSSMEKLCTRVGNFQFGDGGATVLNARNKIAVEKFRDLLHNRNKSRTFKHHLCKYCNQSSNSKNICKNRVLRSEFMVSGSEGKGGKHTWFVSLDRNFHTCGNKTLFKTLKETHGIEAFNKKFQKSYFNG